MAFRFKISESPARGVRRMCHERLRAARSCLPNSGDPEGVHGVRKEIKKLRALLRLVHGEIGPGAYRKCTRTLRDAAICLAATRDARVMLRALQKLAGRSAKEMFPEILKALRKNCRDKSRAFRSGGSAAQADRILKKAGRCMRGLKIKGSGWAAIEPGLKRSYRRGRKACRLARNEPAPGHLHEWRKHVKNLWYYFCLLAPAWPAAMRTRMNDLGLLGVQLGDDHDLFLLQQFLGDAFDGPAKEADALNRLIKTRQAQLRRSALKRGSRLYTETTAAFCRRLKKHWKSWQKTGQTETRHRPGLPPESGAVRS